MPSSPSRFSATAISMGVLAAFVGYAASFAIVLAGLKAMGATDQQAATGLLFATLGMGACGVWLAWTTRTPAAVAWSTPGAAFLASTTALPGGFAEAVAAFIACAVLIIATGFIPLFATLVARIPKPVANALLAGVLLKLCFAPALALGSIPLLFLPILLAWLLGLLWHKLAAMPLAVLAFALVLAFVFHVDAANPVIAGTTANSTALQSATWLPQLTPLTPEFSIAAVISVAIPLYLITMAGQNIPGFTVLELNKFPVDRPPLLIRTGFTSLLIAPFGAVTVNMSAITAALMCSDDAGHDASKRYQAAIACGLVYIALAFGAGAITTLASLAPALLITAVAGLALIPALVASLTAAFSNPEQIEAPAFTFLVAASGISLLGIHAAFWGVVIGVVLWSLKGLRYRRDGD